MGAERDIWVCSATAFMVMWAESSTRGTVQSILRSNLPLCHTFIGLCHLFLPDGNQESSNTMLDSILGCEVEGLQQLQLLLGWSSENWHIHFTAGKSSLASA